MATEEETGRKLAQAYGDGIVAFFDDSVDTPEKLAEFREDLLNFVEDFVSVSEFLGALIDKHGR